VDTFAAGSLEAERSGSLWVGDAAFSGSLEDDGYGFVGEVVMSGCVDEGDRERTYPPGPLED